jgi:hypothetical protein
MSTLIYTTLLAFLREDKSFDNAGIPCETQPHTKTIFLIKESDKKEIKCITINAA